ncbi:ABC transporter ATP-binding protein [Metasolibacillus meyeri]|uniref:ABC transporter ATP-binding protein n=1 Tax=Metasolibacillus meyeri TaxID=1071052 RepID=A0AAW9NY82_9BACL|nr:ABC transporter ATP-binding protein [Metasolibacillus meyeri]MEC1179633.1 ABC transporter ATP-binding protein [Metasolibacillus meyeri]
MGNILEVKGVSKIVKGQTLLNNINLVINEPNIYGIIGRNGSGKSVLFKTIAGILLPTEGTIQVFGEPVGREAFPKDFGALLDAPGFLGHYSAFRNLKLLASIQGKVTDADLREVLTIVGLDPDDTKPVRKYSLGMKQRLGIAQAIMEKPKLLILDEPMNGLDETGVQDIRQMIQSFKEQGIAILLSSHNAEDIAVLCNTVYRMEQGQLVVST